MLLLAFVPPAWAEATVSPEAAFLEANEQYRLGRYDEAAARYEALQAQGVESGALSYNLGNAWLKSGRKGEALWAYRRAEVLMPRDADLEANVEYARSLMAAAESVSVQPPRWVRWLTLQGRVATAELAWAWLVLLWLAAACWIGWMWWRRARPLLRPLAVWVSAAAAIVLIMLVVRTVGVEAVPTAVVISDGAEVRFAPQDAATTHFALPEGAVVRLLQRQDGWAQVRRGDGRSGWLPAGAVRSL